MKRVILYVKEALDEVKGDQHATNQLVEEIKREEEKLVKAG